MTAKWAACIPGDTWQELGELRMRRDIEVLELVGEIWLRGPRVDDELGPLVRKLPGARRYYITDYLNGEPGLLEPGQRVPRRTLPDGEWVRLEDWLRPCAPQAAFSGVTESRVPLRLVESTSELPARVLVCAFERWRVYAVAAPLVRLDGLAFAASADGRALIRVATPEFPLPPLPGDYYSEAEGIATPCGFAWSPAVDARFLRELLKLAEGDLALFGPGPGNACYELIPAAAFVKATRSAVRQSEEVVT